MKKFVFFVFLFFLISGSDILHAQLPKEVEVGVVEHLGDFIPLDLKFTNDSNTVVTLKQFIDKPTILTLVDFQCHDLCGPLLEGVSDVIEKSDLELGNDFQVITLSINDKDSPVSAIETKKNFLKNSKVHAKDWIYLTGDSANIYSLTNAVGFKFKKEGDEFVHPAVIIVLSPKGKITRYLYGTNFLPFDLKMAIIESQKGLERPTINKVLEFCFNYDPVGKKYVLDVTKISGTIILFFSVLFFSILLIRGRRRKKKNIIE